MKAGAHPPRPRRRATNKGVGIEAVHFVGDGLWGAGAFE